MDTSYNYCMCSNDAENFYLISECVKDDIYYRIDFKIEDNNIDVAFINTDKCEFKKAKYDLNVKKIIINENDISINIDCDIEFDFGDKVSFNINKTFNKDTEIYKNLYDQFDQVNNKFVMKHINLLIKEKSLYNNSDFIYDNIDTLFEIIKMSERKSENIEPIECELKLDRERVIKEAQNFLDKININIDINTLINDNSIVFIDENEECEEKNSADGISYYDNENNKKMIKIREFNNIKEVATLVHEILHYTNQPIDNKRNTASDYLTEVVSYSYELILADTLLDGEYKNEAQPIFNNIIRTLSYFSYLLYTALLSIKLFKENGIVTAKDVNEYCDFEKYIKEMKEYIKEQEHMGKKVWNCLGYFLGIYNYIEYKKDNNFVDKLLELNNSINTKSFEECLSIIGLNSIEDIFEKGIKNIDEYRDMLISKPKVKVKK